MFDLDSYHKASTVAEAIALLAQNPQAIPIAGGTDVLVRLHQGHPDYRHLVDIHDVAELKSISMEPDGSIVIGSGATFTDLMEARIITSHIPVVAEGASWVGGPQVRNMATVGGNISNGAPSADSAAPLLVLNAAVVLKGPQGTRQMPLHEFYQGPGRLDLQQAEIMTALRIAPPLASTSTASRWHSGSVSGLVSPSRARHSRSRSAGVGAVNSTIWSSRRVKASSKRCRPLLVSTVMPSAGSSRCSRKLVCAFA